MSEERQIEVLIVGAGNIGRVYGYHISKAGAKVHFYVREHNRQNLTNYPLRVHRLSSMIRWLNNSKTEKFSDYTVTTDEDIAKGVAPNLPEQLDYVIFAVPANRLAEGDWLKNLITFLNNKYQKNVYYTSPIPDETEMQRIIDMGIDKTQLISAQTNTCSYFAPLANQKIEPRGEAAKKEDEEDNPNKVIVYCNTGPETFGQFTEEAKDATDDLVELLNKGDLPAQNIGKETQYGTFGLFITPIFVGFSMYNWNFYNAGRDINTMTYVIAALCETAQIVMKKTNNNCSPVIKMIPFVPTLLFCSILIFLHFVATNVITFDMETFLNAHFKLKLGEQTDYLTEVVKKEGEKYEVSLTNLNKVVNKYNEIVKKNK